MRFFSNDARETSDEDSTNDEAEARPVLDGDPPERVQSDPVAVPQQRPPSASPWAASPGTLNDRTPADAAPSDAAPDLSPVVSATESTERTDSADGELADREQIDGTSSSPFADATGDTDATDGRHLDTADRDVHDDGLPGLDTGELHEDRAGSHAADADTDTDADERAPFHPPAEQQTAFGAATVGGAVAASARAGQINDTDGRTDDPDRPSTVASPTDANTVAWTSPDTDKPADEDAPSKDDVSDLALEDGGTFADPVVVEKNGNARTFADPSGTSDADADADTDEAEPVDVDEPVVAVATPPKEQLPGTIAAPELGPLFADAGGFRDRWRDVQLRFVDDPKAAADDAATLVDEAVDALATSLRTQKDQLTGATPADDTEQLRVRIRSYRDFLDRLLNL